MKYIKKMLPVFLLALVLVIGITLLTPSTHAAEQSEFTYMGGNQVIITGYTGKDADLVIPDTIDGKTVTAISASAFKMNHNLETVTLSNNITSIGKFAFANCDNLRSVTLSNRVTTIEDNAFAACPNLVEISLPASLRTLGLDVFADCTGLKAIWVDAGNRYYSSDASGVLFSKDGYVLIQAPSGLTGIYTVPETTYTIKASAFRYCSDLEEVILPPYLTGLGEYAFANCTGLQYVTIPDILPEIGNGAFAWCTGLQRVNIGYSVTSIGADAFNGCSGLTAISFPSKVTTIGSYAFNGCSGLKSLHISNNITTVGNYAFADCTALENLRIGENVGTIGRYAFSGCTALTSASLGSGTAVVGESAFNGCSALTNIALPAGTKTIASYAFDGCNALQNIYFAGDATQWSKVSVGGRNDGFKAAAVQNGHIHNFVAVEGASAEATCTERGYITYQCAEDSVTFTDYSAVLGHSKGEATASVAPTCTGKGYDESACQRCGEPLHINHVAALGHELYKLPSVDPTCTEDGIQGGTACSRCEAVLIESVTVKPLGHTYVDDICTVCGDDIRPVETVHVHDWLNFAAITPSCTQPGNIAYRQCFYCRQAETAEGEPLEEGAWVLPINDDHQLIHIDAMPNSCEGSGHEAYDYCLACFRYFYDDPEKTTYEAGIVPAAGHAWTEVAAVAPTCETAGNTAYKLCSVCGIAQTPDGQFLPAYGWELNPLGHSYVEHPHKEPTCTENGWYAYTTCENCDYSTTYRELAALGHWYINHPGKASTCTEAGWESYQTCYDCDYTSYKELPLAEHTYVDGVCSVCQQSAPETPEYLPGDFNGDNAVSNEDVIALLWNTLFPEENPLEIPGDLTGDNAVSNEDVIKLLWHCLFPEENPL